jgi:DNA-binding GntR family transcriptional regulator
MPVPQDRASAPRKLLRDVAYDKVRAAILDGTLAPGEKLQDAELGAWLKLSRTPIREALARLEEDGLVETFPQRFTRVAPLDREQARDTFQLVAAIQALAARLAVPNVTNEAIQRMKAANRDFKTALTSSDADAAIIADDTFHAIFVELSGNQEIPRALERLLPRLRRLERMRFSSLPGRRSVKQHKRIITAAAGGDPEAAAEAAMDNWLALGTLIDQSFPVGEDASEAVTSASEAG